MATFTALPLIETRLGIDLNPIDLNIPAERLWAFSLVWPDQQERLERLKAAMQILKDNPVKIHRGGANDILPMMIQNLQAGLIVCVMHSFTLNQFSTDDREKFENVLRSSSLKRDIWRVSLEWLDTESPELSLDHFADGTRIGHEVLANCHQHGEWIEWRPKTKASV